MEQPNPRKPLRFDGKGYKNWLIVGQAMQVVKATLVPKIATVVHTMHERMTEEVAALPPCGQQCTTKNILKDKSGFEPTCAAHDAFLDLILAQKTSGSIHLHNSDVRKWLTEEWEVAKIFMGHNIPKNTTNAEDTDMANLLVLMDHCEAFRDVASLEAIQAVVYARNQTMHSHALELDEAKKEEYFDKMANLLKGANIPPEQIQEGLGELNLLKERDFVITDGEEICLIKQRLEEQALNTRALEDTLTKLGADVESLRGAISKIQQSIEDAKGSLNFLARNPDLYDAMEKDISNLRNTMEAAKLCIESPAQNSQAQKRPAEPFEEPGSSKRLRMHGASMEEKKQEQLGQMTSIGSSIQSHEDTVQKQIRQQQRQLSQAGQIVEGHSRECIDRYQPQTSTVVELDAGTTEGSSRWSLDSYQPQTGHRILSADDGKLRSPSSPTVEVDIGVETANTFPSARDNNGYKSWLKTQAGRILLTDALQKLIMVTTTKGEKVLGEEHARYDLASMLDAMLKAKAFIDCVKNRRLLYEMIDVDHRVSGMNKFSISADDMKSHLNTMIRFLSDANLNKTIGLSAAFSIGNVISIRDTDECLTLEHEMSVFEHLICEIAREIGNTHHKHCADQVSPTHILDQQKFDQADCLLEFLNDHADITGRLSEDKLKADLAEIKTEKVGRMTDMESAVSSISDLATDAKEVAVAAQKTAVSAKKKAISAKGKAVYAKGKFHREKHDLQADEEDVDGHERRISVLEAGRKDYEEDFEELDGRVAVYENIVDALKERIEAMSDR